MNTLQLLLDARTTDTKYATLCAEHELQMLLGNVADTDTTEKN